jgi:hypothetical protein
MSDEDPLEELYVDSSEINKERLSEALSGILGIDKDTGRSVILSGFSDLNQSQKVYAYLLSRRVAHELDRIDEDELGVSSSEMEDDIGVPPGTIRRYCSESRLKVKTQKVAT